MSETDDAAPFSGADPDTVSFVTSSTYRVATVDALRDGPEIPSKIAEQTGHGIAHISRALQRLSDRDIVECLVPDRRKNRYYDLTADGEEFVEQVGHLIDAEVGGDSDGE